MHNQQITFLHRNRLKVMASWQSRCKQWAAASRDVCGTTPAYSPGMRKTMEHLLTLQKLNFDTRPQTATWKIEVEKIRTEVPPPILAHYERLVLRGKKGVAIARKGVCSECNLRITNGRLIGLVHRKEVQLCDNCGRYLYLPEGELTGLPETKPVPVAAAKHRSKKPAGHLV